MRPLKAKRLVNILAEREAQVKVDTVIETLGNVEAYYCSILCLQG